jgi:hypothetical protein
MPSSPEKGARIVLLHAGVVDLGKVALRFHGRQLRPLLARIQLNQNIARLNPFSGIEFDLFHDAGQVGAHRHPMDRHHGSHHAER